METRTSAFYSDSIKLSFKDWIRLLFGGIVSKEWSSFKIGLWKMPDNGCKCDECRKYFKR